MPNPPPAPEVIGTRKWPDTRTRALYSQVLLSCSENGRGFGSVFKEQPIQQRMRIPELLPKVVNDNVVQFSGGQVLWAAASACWTIT